MSALPAALLAKLGNLELIARAAVDGVVQGAHRTDRPGFSQEFAAYRDYEAGDDLRFIDWNAYARTDRLHLKLFEGETNTRLLVLLDASASMAASGRDAPPRRPSKLQYGAWLAAALIHIAVRQHDAVGLATFADAVRDDVPPGTGERRRQALFACLEAVQADGGSDWETAFAHVAQRLRGRGIVAAISDFYCEPRDFGQAVAMLGARGHDLIVFHVLDAQERRPRIRRNTTLRDAETGRVIEVDAADMHAGYPRRLAAHEAALRREAAAAGAHYVAMDAEEPLDRALVRYMRFRARHP
jgi:uncharacterized protein (DUF58 family)